MATSVPQCFRPESIRSPSACLVLQTRRSAASRCSLTKPVNLHISMQLGNVGQSIEVEAAEPLVDSATSSLGQVVEEKQILNMPLNGRNPYTLGLLVGNTTQLFGVQSNLPFVAGGGRFTAVDVSLDGVDNNTVTNAGNIGRTGIAIVPSVDAVQEFKVETNKLPRTIRACCRFSGEHYAEERYQRVSRGVF